jgi:hypothetical protein
MGWVLFRAAAGKKPESGRVYPPRGQPWPPLRAASDFFSGTAFSPERRPAEYWRRRRVRRGNFTLAPASGPQNATDPGQLAWPVERVFFAKKRTFPISLDPGRFARQVEESWWQ